MYLIKYFGLSTLRHIMNTLLEYFELVLLKSEEYKCYNNVCLLLTSYFVEIIKVAKYFSSKQAVALLLSTQLSGMFCFAGRQRSQGMWAVPRDVKMVVSSPRRRRRVGWLFSECVRVRYFRHIFYLMPSLPTGSIHLHCNTEKDQSCLWSTTSSDHSVFIVSEIFPYANDCCHYRFARPLTWPVEPHREGSIVSMIDYIKRSLGIRCFRNLSVRQRPLPLPICPPFDLTGWTVDTFCCTVCTVSNNGWIAYLIRSPYFRHSIAWTSLYRL